MSERGYVDWMGFHGIASEATATMLVGHLTVLYSGGRPDVAPTFRFHLLKSDDKFVVTILGPAGPLRPSTEVDLTFKEICGFCRGFLANK